MPECADQVHICHSLLISLRRGTEASHAIDTFSSLWERHILRTDACAHYRVPSFILPHHPRSLSELCMQVKQATIPDISEVRLFKWEDHLHCHVPRESTIPKNQSRSLYYFLYIMSSILRPLVTAARTRCVCTPSTARAVARSFHATPSSKLVW